MITSARRIQSVADLMSPRQIVLAELIEAKKRGSFFDYAREYLRRPFSTLPCHRISEALNARLRAMDPYARSVRIREAQREAMFLGQLFRIVNADILQEMSVHQLRLDSTRLLIKLTLEQIHRGTPTPMRRLESGAHLAIIEAAHAEAYREAAGYISATYFDDVDVLFKEVKATLEGVIADASVLFPMMHKVVDTIRQLAAEEPSTEDDPSGITPEELADTASRAADPALVKDKATRRAREWVLRSKARVHGAMGESEQQRRCLAEAMGVGG